MITPQPKAERRPYPGFWSAVVLLIVPALMAFPVVFVFIISANLAGMNVVPLMRPAGLAFQEVAAAIALVFAYYRIGRPPLIELFAWKPVPRRLVGPMVMTAIGAGLLLVLLDVIARFLGSTDAPEPTILHYGPWVAFLFMVVTGPVTEELLFRGVMMRGFLERYTRGQAILVNAALFGLAHLDPVRIVSASIIGVLFAWLRARTGSLKPSLIAHASLNAVPFGWALLTLIVPSGRTEATAADPTVVATFSVPLATLGAVLTWSGISRLKKELDALGAG